MGRSFELIISFFLISQKLQTCVAFDAVSIATTAMKFGKSVYDITQIMLKDDTSDEDVATSIKNLNQQIQEDMTYLTDTLTDFPSIIRLEMKKETLEGHFAIIGQVFQEASRIKKEIMDGKIDRNNSKYQRFALKDKEIDHSIYEIRRTLTDNSTTTLLKQKFTDSLKEFDNVCKTGMSHLQLLNNLLGNLKLATVQYYLSKKFMYEFLELIGEDNSVAKQTLLRNVQIDYAHSARIFKNIMSTASSQLWKCDPSGGYNDEVRYTNETDPDFAELRIFSKYIFNEDNFVPFGEPCVNKKCNAITKLTCQTTYRHLCSEVRKCSGRLIGCQQYTRAYPNTGIDVCENYDGNAYHRYLSVAARKKTKFSLQGSETDEKFQCKDGKKRSIYTVTVGSYRNAAACDYCGCLCEEHEYFVDDRFVQSDIESNKVVTGAKFVVEDKTLRLQIQQAKLMANGIIDKATLEWIPLVPIDKNSRAKISFDEYKKFALTPVIDTDDGVVIGMSLLTDVENKLIYLRAGTIDLEFETGVLKKKLFKVKGNEPTQQYNMTNRDVSTKSEKENTPDSTDEQFVELTITDLAKDGGQSVVPFIDTRSVTANGPLSGASLYVRGQPGYGGFLAIMLSIHLICGSTSMIKARLEQWNESI